MEVYSKTDGLLVFWAPLVAVWASLDVFIRVPWVSVRKEKGLGGLGRLPSCLNRGVRSWMP